MNTDIIQEWIADLESGEIEQGRGALAIDDGTGHRSYCCLGVLCEIAVRHGIISPAKSYNPELESEEHTLNYDGAASMPPAAVAKWVFGYDAWQRGEFTWEVLADKDIMRHNGDGTKTLGTRKGQRVNLDALNDSYAYTFPEIAELIRNQWLAEELATV